MKLLFSTPRELLYDGDRLKKEPEESWIICYICPQQTIVSN